MLFIALSPRTPSAGGRHDQRVEKCLGRYLVLPPEHRRIGDTVKKTGEEILEIASSTRSEVGTDDKNFPGKKFI